MIDKIKDINNFLFGKISMSLGGDFAQITLVKLEDCRTK